MLGSLKPQQPDKILALMGEFQADTRQGKIDLGVGVYRDASGRTPIMRAVKEAERRLVETETTKTYTALPGEPAFRAAMAGMILGDAVPVGRAASLATVGGTGAIRQGLELARLASPGLTVWYSDPTWPNHVSILDFMGLPKRTYRYFDNATRGVDFEGTQIRKGAVDAVLKSLGDKAPAQKVRELNDIADGIAKEGGTPLAVVRNGDLLGVIYLKDIVKGGIRERFAELRQMGIRTVMITGDNPMTAAAIAAEAGVDDFLAEATPENKLDLIRQEQAKGKLVAMCGDGTNDAPALAQADVGVAMNTGTVAAREAGNMVDLDSDPTKLIEVVGIGKQLLMTRGSLTTFSIANDVAKYFAIVPAMFITLYPQLATLNIMGLSTPQSAILSAIIFNALIIVALIPLALKGVTYRAIGANALLRRNLLIYGLGGLIAPFIGIKLIDVVITAAGLV